MAAPGRPEIKINAADNARIEASLLPLFRAFTPFLLTQIGHNLIASLEKAGQFKPLVEKAASSLNVGSVADYRGASLISRKAAAHVLITPDLMHGTMDQLQVVIDKELNEKFIRSFIREFMREFNKQAENSVKFADLERLVTDFLNICTEWLAFGRGTTFEKYLNQKDKNNNQAQFFIILDLVSKTLVELVVKQRTNKNITGIFQQVMPKSESVRVATIGWYMDTVVQEEGIRKFAEKLIEEVFKAIFESAVPRPRKVSESESKIEDEKEEVKAVEKDDAEQKLVRVQKLEATLVETAVAVKPLVIAATKRAITPERLPKLREDILDAVGKYKSVNQKIKKWVLPHYASKEKTDQLIDRIATAFTPELCQTILDKIPAAKKHTFLNLLQQFVSNTLSNAMGVSYTDTLANNINTRELINELVAAIKSLKPKDWAGILKVAFPNWFERQAAHFFLKFLSSGQVLMEIIENAAGELHRRVDPELGGFLQNLQNYEAQLKAVSKEKNITSQMGNQLAAAFDKVCGEAVEANKALDRRLAHINKELDKQKLLNQQILRAPAVQSSGESKQVSDIPATVAVLQNNLVRLDQERDKLEAAKKSIAPLCDPLQAALMRLTLRQGDRAQLQKLAKKLDKIEEKLVDLLKEISGNTFMEKVRGWFMPTESDKQSYLAAQRQGRQVERDHATELQAKTLAAFAAISAKLEFHSKTLNSTDSALAGHKEMEVSTTAVYLALMELFKAANDMAITNKNAKIKAMADELAHLAAPVVSMKR